MNVREHRHGDPSRQRDDRRGDYLRAPRGGYDLDRNSERQANQGFPPEQPNYRVGTGIPRPINRPTPAARGDTSPPLKKQKVARDRDDQIGWGRKSDRLAQPLQDSNSTPIQQPRMAAATRDVILHQAYVESNCTLRVDLSSGERRTEIVPRCTPDMKELIASHTRLSDSDAAFAYEQASDLACALGDRVAGSAGQAELQNARVYSEDEVPIGTIIDHVDLERCRDFNPHGKNARDSRRTTMTPHGMVFHGPHQKIVISYSKDLYGQVWRQCRRLSTGGGMHLARSQEAWKEGRCATAIVISKDEPLPPEVEKEAPNVPRLHVEFDRGRQAHELEWGAVDFGKLDPVDCRDKVEVVGRLTKEAMALMQTYVNDQSEVERTGKSLWRIREDRQSTERIPSSNPSTAEESPEGNNETIRSDDPQTLHAGAGAEAGSAVNHAHSDSTVEALRRDVVMGQAELKAESHDPSHHASVASRHPMRRRV